MTDLNSLRLVAWEAVEELAHFDSDVAAKLRAALNQPVTVFIIGHGEYSNYQVDGVFSSKEKVNEFLARHVRPESALDESYDVREVVLDEELEKFHLPFYQCNLRISDGAIEYEQDRSPDWHRPDYSEAFKFSDTAVIGYSVISADHARKVAAEFRQKLLREQGQ